MKPLIIGAEGHLGSAFYHHFGRYHHNLFATSRRIGSPLRFFALGQQPDWDWTELRHQGYTHVLLAAGISRISDCEQSPEATFEINVTANLELAHAASQAGILPVLFSSDYVFDGQQAPYDDSAALHPLNHYGQQKAALEKSLFDYCGNAYLLLRISKIYTSQPGDGTLLSEMHARLLVGQDLSVAHDQYFNPLCIEDLLSVLEILLVSQARGLYNLASPEDWSREAIARELCLAMGLVPEKRLQLISLADLKEDFQRPFDTRLRCTRLSQELNYAFRPLTSQIEYLLSLA